jgi:3-methyladenine DNA glycosylase/8-oxoguanine DNA glycosylase
MSFSMKKTGGRMWHEARKQEKKIRGMLVDYRRRAERRRDYYEKIVSFVLHQNCELIDFLLLTFT